MKRLVIPMLLTVLFAHDVYAQSSVTLYGIVDAGIAYANNAKGGSLVQANAGTLQGDRWGLKGVEDLGGGLKALFVLENGFNVYTGSLGQGGAEFGRQAYVGISSDYATVALGRQYDMAVNFTGPFEFGNQPGGVFSIHPGDLDNLANSNRVNNAITVKTATYRGFSAGALYSLGGFAGQFNRNQLYSLGAGYTNGPLRAGVGYINARNPNFSFFGTNPSASATQSNMSSTLIYSGFASAKTYQMISAGADYTFGKSTLGALYSNTQFKDLGDNAALNPQNLSGSARIHNVEVNFKYQFTPALVVGVAYDYTKGYSASKSEYHIAALGVDYALSKRTDLYANAVYEHAAGTDSTGAPAHAQLLTLSPSTTSNQVGTTLGIRHKF